VLLSNQKSRGFDEKLLFVVIFHWRLLVELDDRRFFCDGDFRARYFRHEVLAHLPEIVVRGWSCNGLSRDDDPGCFYSLGRAVVPCD